VSGEHNGGLGHGRQWGPGAKPLAEAESFFNIVTYNFQVSMLL